MYASCSLYLIVIIDIIVMALIIIIDVPLPEWSYSCLFYIQVKSLTYQVNFPIVILDGSSSFHFPTTFTQFGRFVSTASH